MSDRKSSLHASEAIFQPPRGERLTSQTFGPSGIHERLNCWLKNLLMKVFSHFFMVSSSYPVAASSFSHSISKHSAES